MLKDGLTDGTYGNSFVFYDPTPDNYTQDVPLLDLGSVHEVSAVRHTFVASAAPTKVSVTAGPNLTTIQHRRLPNYEAIRLPERTRRAYRCETHLRCHDSGNTDSGLHRRALPHDRERRSRSAPGLQIPKGATTVSEVSSTNPAYLKNY
eukprot:1030211-Prymnesium_polylepis.1